MSNYGAISYYSATAGAAAVLLVGSAAFWGNPGRRINCWFFTLSVHVAVWLMCVSTAKQSEEGEGLFWLRVSSAAGAFVPFHLWLLKEAAIERLMNLKVLWRRGFGWFICSVALAITCFTGFFIPANSTSELRIVGWGYWGYMAGLVLLYGALSKDTVRKMKIQEGVVRLELQILLLGGSAVGVTILSIMAIEAVIRAKLPIQIKPLLVLIPYGFTVVGINTHRIFDARQVLLVVAEKSALILASAVVAWIANVVLSSILPPGLGSVATTLIVTTALTLWFAAEFNSKLNGAFQFYPQATSARQAAFAAAGREAQLEKLEAAFLSILKGWGQTDRAVVVSGSLGAYSGGGIELLAEDNRALLMRQVRWATPERLARERPTPARDALAKFLADHHLGVLVATEGPTLNALVGVGVPASRRPFTYPQVTQLLELAAIIENALERAHLSAKAQHAEQLATVGLLGASLAHEIRNPLVSIKTFVQLLPNHYQDQAFRDKFFRLISDEVTRIDRLTEQLLDLASPRVYSAKSIELHAVLRESVDLVAAKATGKNVELRSDFQASPDIAHADPAAVKQVLLNLCFNAIQAVETQFGERWVKITTRNSGPNIELAVSDSGPGISPAIWPKLFQPFQSTKSSGFGLGLAICKDILTNLNATISVDQPTPGLGATFRVTFPCRH